MFAAFFVLIHGARSVGSTAVDYSDPTAPVWKRTVGPPDIPVIPCRGLAVGGGIGTGQRERDGELGVFLANALLAQIDLQRTKPQKNRKRILTASVNRRLKDRIAVDPGNEIRRQVDTEIAAFLKRARSSIGDMPGCHGIEGVGLRMP